MVILKTRGDAVTDRPIAAVGSTGVFVKELEEALLAKEVDLAVHSLKDLETRMPTGLTLAAVPARAPVEDCLIAPGPVTVDTLPEGALVASGSPRRVALLRDRRPDLVFAPLRGNVPTRIGKVIAGATGSGKTFVAQRIIQEMLDFYPRGDIRLFIIEDSNEIVLNGWDGNKKSDTGNIIYTVTRPESAGGPPPVTMYDLIRAALRSRPHGVVIGEARGPEAWELARAAATGHGHSAFTIHATSAEHVWPRFLQVVRAHPDAEHMSEFQLAQSFAEAVKATYPYYGIRLLGGVLYLTGMLIMAYNTWKTVAGQNAVDAPIPTVAAAHA